MKIFSRFLFVVLSAVLFVFVGFILFAGVKTAKPKQTSLMPKKPESEIIKIQETKDHYIYTINVPSAHLNTLKIVIKNNSLVLMNQIKNPEQQSPLMAYLSHHTQNIFQRVIELPANTDKQNITPVDENGVLTISVKKI